MTGTSDTAAEADGVDPGRHMRLLMDRVPAMLAYWGRDLRCRFANRAYERWFGVDPESLVGTPLRDLLGPALYALNEPHIQAALKGEEQVFERLIPGPDGVRRHGLAHYVPDVVDGEVLGFLVQVSEITQVKQAEQTLRTEIANREHAYQLLCQSDLALREAQRLGQIGSWEWDIPSDVTAWSDELYCIFGRDPTLPSPSYAQSSQLYSPDSWPRLQAAIDHILATGEPYTIELKFIKPDGGAGWIEARGEAILDEMGQVVKLRGTALDITDRCEVVEARIQRDLAEASNQRKTLFLSRASHELRTPLNGILGFAQLIRTRPLGDPERQWLDLLLAAGWRMRDLIEGLFDISEAESGQIDLASQPVDLSVAVHEGLSQWADLSSHAALEVANRVPDGVWVRGDPHRVTQVVDHLLSNAIKYNRPGGQVKVSVDMADGQVALTVRDTGPGLSDEQLGRLFRPFDRLGAEFSKIEGTGIGLVLSKRLLALMGGSIEVSSRLGEGSSFVATFQASDPPQ